MTDVTKVGGAPPQLANRPTPSSKDAQKPSADDAKTGDASAASETFRLPGSLSGGEGQALTAAEALKAVFASLTKAFSDAEDNPPQSGDALEKLLSDIKVAAPILDRVIAARKDELTAQDDQAGLQALQATLAEAEEALADARAKLEELAGGLPAEEVVEDAEVTAALNAILGEDREIPAFSPEELQEGRLEFIALVFEDIAETIGRHQAAGTQSAAYTLSALGGTNLTA